MGGEGDGTGVEGCVDAGGEGVEVDVCDGLGGGVESYMGFCETEVCGVEGGGFVRVTDADVVHFPAFEVYM